MLSEVIVERSRFFLSFLAVWIGRTFTCGAISPLRSILRVEDAYLRVPVVVFLCFPGKVCLWPTASPGLGYHIFSQRNPAF